MLADTVLIAVRSAAYEHPARRAILAPGKAPTSHADLIAHLDALHAVFARHGIGHGTRVATVLPNGAETAVASLALATCATCVPLNPAYSPAELSALLAATRAALVLTDRDLLPRIRAGVDALGLPVGVIEKDADATAGWFRLDLSAVPEMRQSGVPGPPGTDDVALVLHTSGSTAKAKIVPLTQRNLAASMGNLAMSLALGPGDICLNMLPLFHVGALVDLLFAPLAAGGSVVVTGSIATETFFDCLTAFRPTWYQGVPTMLQDIVSLAPERLNPGDAASLRFIRAVSAPLPAKVEADVEATFGVPVIAIYGMTETAGVIASNPLPPETRKSGSVGKPVGCAVAVADGQGNPVAPGARGEVIVSGDNVTSGYEGADEVRRLNSFGKWLRTGDEGYLDADNFLFLTGRIKEIINRGGEKIAPRQIEECLMDLAGVREAAAFAIPHPTLGEDVAVAVVREPGAHLSDEAIRDHLAARLSRFKVPRHVAFLDTLPRLPSGKLDRRSLAARGAAAAPGHHSLRAPANPLEGVIVRLCKQVLEVDAVGLDDNFFDLGGDSLKATTLVMSLEEALGREIPPGILFDASTVGELAACLSTDRAGVGAANGDDELPRWLRKAVARAIAGWRGTRRSADSLLVGRNTLGAERPLFWVFNGESEFTPMAAHLDPERPLYAMRSMTHIGKKFHRDTAPLARYYVGEILRVQSEGPFLLGGFCEGAKLAFEVAGALRTAGHEVALLVLHDGFVPQPYDGAVTIFHSDGYPCLAPDVTRAERGWHRYYTGALSVLPAPAFHARCYEEPGAASMASELEAEFERVARAAVARERRFPDARQLDAAIYRARVAGLVWPLQPQGSNLTVTVTVRNDSPLAWQPSAASGISLGARWLNLNGHPYGWLADQTDLVAPLAPGESRAFTLRAEVPTRDRPMFLEIDMLEEGVGWFHERGSRSRRALVLPFRPRGHRVATTARRD